ncbi:uncharacterized protein BCR38DRAFT_451860 [Pseudomassariella vexata]|uniref:Acyl-CoA desaturase n=1 Tax=Pseudomassariella vexata TaxID=1141098 RepID=A0A1Y2D9I3_9PEZI|nr:uncharacterized protein BCR38DRAFT_451860 [Pseudomassariella vexata]ORY55908.1 hypothetical protein BCR38DRAFT_451860 [Pseudomassariella vexata]
MNEKRRNTDVPESEKLTQFDIFKSNYDINWRHVPVILGVPMLALLGALTTELTRPTLIWSIIFYFLTGFGITAGYHRLWCHRTFVASLPLQVFLLVCATASIQGSVIWWCTGHRLHHRYTDTSKDPYSVHRGLLWSHIGWLLVIEHDLPKGEVDVSDLTKDPLLIWQDKEFDWFSPVCALLLPTVVAGLGWGDWRGGFVYAAVVRLVFVHHATFSVNSIAHYLGDRPYDNKSAGDSTITALATLGEGNHCFHHAYPTDYRNGIRWYQYDPTKWIIALYGALGIATDLNTFNDNEIQKGMIQTSQRRLDDWNETINWGRSLRDLPVIDMDDFRASAKAGRPLILISGIIYDVTDWVAKHPGGKKIIKSAIGKDATAMFNGGVYNHSRVARNLLDNMRVGIVRGGMEVQIFSKQDVLIKGETTTIVEVAECTGDTTTGKGTGFTR